MAHLVEIGLANALLAGLLALVALAAGAARRSRPALVHGLWVLVLLKLVTPPLIRVPTPLKIPTAAIAQDEAEESVPDEPVPTSIPVVVAVAPEVPAPRFMTIEELADGPDGQPRLPRPDEVMPAPRMPVVVPAPVAARPLPRPDVSLKTASPAPTPVLHQVFWLVGCVWLGGAFVWFAITSRRVLLFHRLLRDARLAPLPFQNEARHLAARLGLRWCPEVFLLPGQLPPLLWALGRPRLFFPATLLPRLSTRGQTALLLHELSHVARRDHWVRWLEVVASGLFWWYPIVWLACRRLQSVEEECCDALVVTHAPECGPAYARALLTTVDFLATPHPALPPAASGFGRVHQLKRRLTMIVRGTPSPGLSRLCWLVLLSLSVVLPLIPSGARTAAPPPAQKKADTAVTPEDLPPEPLTYQSPVALATKGGQVWAVAVSPDGKTLAVVSGAIANDEGALTLWDMTQESERAFLLAKKPLRCVAFSRDGKVLATGEFDNMIRLRNPKTGKVTKTLVGHTGAVNAIAFSPDGKTLYSASLDKTVRSWNLTTGKQIKSVAAHDDWVLSLALSSDGKTLVTGSKDKTAKVWDAPDLKQRLHLKGHTNWIETVAIAPDDNTVATGSHDRAIKLWDGKSGKMLHTVTGHGDVVNALVFLDDNKTLASTSHDRTVRTWDWTDGLAPLTILNTLHGERVYGLAVTGNDEFITGSWDRTVKVWDAGTSTEKTKLTPGRYAPAVTFPVHSLATADGKTLLVGGESRVAKLVDTTTGQALHTLKGHGDVIAAVAMSREGKTAATASYDGTVKVWNVADGRLLHTLKGHDGWVFAVAFSRDGKRLVSGGYDKTVRLWDPVSGKALGVVGKHKGSARCVVFSPDGKRIACGGPDKKVKVWDVARNKLVQTLDGHEDLVRSIDFSPDGTRLVSGGDDSTVRLWDVGSGKELKKLQLPDFQREVIRAVAYSPRGRSIAVGSNDQQVRILDPDTLVSRSQMFVQTLGVTSVVYSADGQTLFSGGENNTIYSWSPAIEFVSPQVSYRSGLARWVTLASPDGKMMALGGGDKTLQVRAADQVKSLGHLKGVGSSVFHIALSPDGGTLAIACMKGIYLYDAATKKQLAHLSDHADRVWCVAFSEDGKTLAAASGSWDAPTTPGEVKLWDVKTRKVKKAIAGVSASAQAVALAKGGKYLAYGTRDNLAKIIDLATGKEKHVFKDHTKEVRTLVFSPDGTHLTTGSSDGTVIVWAVKTGKKVTTLKGNPVGVNCVAWSPDGKRLAAISKPSPTGQPLPAEVHVWEVMKNNDNGLSFKQKHVLKGSHQGYGLSLAFASDSRTLASCGGYMLSVGECVVWDAVEGKERFSLRKTGNWIEAVCFSKDGKTLYTGSPQQTSHVEMFGLDLANGWVVKDAHKDTISVAAWSRDGSLLATGSFDKSVKVWDGKTGHLKGTMDAGAHVRSLVFSPDGKRLLAGTAKGEAILWDVVRCKQLKALAKHALAVTAVAWSPDGKWIATGSAQDAKAEGEVKVFNAATGQVRTGAAWDKRAALSLAFSPDNKTLATGSAGAPALIVYDVQTGKVLRSVTGAVSIRCLAFSPDGRTLATGHGMGGTRGDGSIQLWDTRRWKEKKALTGHAKLCLTLSFLNNDTLISGSIDGTSKRWSLKTAPPPPIRTAVPAAP